jgi:RNA helicase HrpA
MTNKVQPVSTPIRLPIHDSADELVAALTTHSVVVVEGETGCGKTTQIPQILMDRGLLPDGLMLGVTQPRRIAAISVAERIAHERGDVLGGEVGYAIRFHDRTSPQTRIKVMTDGLLLREARSDPELSRYGIIMVDEAHERTLNIDFTIGLLHQLLQRRPDFKVVISSATIDPAIFSKFFGGVPHLCVEARTHDVDVQYRPISTGGFQERISDIATTVQRIHKRKESGDVLVFLTGEAEIKMVIAEIERRGNRDAWLLPLYGRLTREEQELIFHSTPQKFRRKIVFSTNIAETSITIDGIRTVVDLGLAKVPSYNPASGMMSLTEQPISKASARQRAGRSGRTAPGLAIRLYDKKSFRDRAPFETEEVRRVDLTDVVLRLVDLGVTNVHDFPFLTAPPKRLIRGAIDELIAMDAIGYDHKLTDIGRSMVPFPLSARLARMIVEASERHPTVMDQVLSVGAFLSIRSPQIYPQGEEDEARRAHRAFASPHGDLVATVRLLDAYVDASDRSAFCERYYLDPLLMSEVLHIRAQLRDIANDVGLTVSSGGPVEDLLRCVLIGLPRNIACRQRRGNRYETVTGAQVSIHPGSCLVESRPQLIVAAECVVTRRAWARTVTAVRPEWVAELFPALADRWQLRKRSTRSGRGSRQTEMPRQVLVGGEPLKVKVRRGMASVDIPWPLLRDSMGAALDPNINPKQLSMIRGRLLVNGSRLLSGWPLLRILAVAPYLRVGEKPMERWPDGELLVAEREWSTILRFVPEILRLARVSRRRKLSFLTLVHNGAGGYWFEATRDLGVAVEQSVSAVESLLAEPILTEQDRPLLENALDRLTPFQSAIHST